ncbi:MAG TPA: hypothetical protein VNG12_13875 [Acidimicrobiales bacterium]|nr:hypothetical protein [Acidimicrobiales bacterium]
MLKLVFGPGAAVVVVAGGSVANEAAVELVLVDPAVLVEPVLVEKVVFVDVDVDDRADDGDVP